MIIGFNGEFLANRERARPERLEYYAALGRAAAESARVPCAVMFNECPNDDWIRQAIRLGFNLAMLADAMADPADLTRRVAAMVRFSAHPKGVAVEAEWGVLPCERGWPRGRGPVPLTDPDSAAALVRETGIDVFAVSVGDVAHILLEGRRDLDLARLAAIRRKVDLPLALHGGSGIADGALAAAIELGVAKVNYGTYLKQRSLSALRRKLTVDDGNPHHALGYGADADLMVAVRQAVHAAVVERIGLLGCCGKA